MANSIRNVSKRNSGEKRLVLQVTDKAKAAGLVEENNDGDATRLADTRVYAFEDLLLVADRDTDRMKNEDVAELVASAARDTGTAFQAINAAVSISGGGYRAQLPNAVDAGFREGKTPHVQTGPGVLVIHRTRSERLANDLVSLRRQQVNERMNHG